MLQALNLKSGNPDSFWPWVTLIKSSSNWTTCYGTLGLSSSMCNRRIFADVIVYILPFLRNLCLYFEYCRSKSTRANHPFKIQTKSARINAFKYSFFVRIIKEWNNLPNHVLGHDINDINANRFKSNLKKWMKIH